MTRRIFSLVLAMMKLVGTMFAIPAAAHEHLDCEDCIVFVNIDGVRVPISLAEMRMIYVCGCSNPSYEYYVLNPHNYTRFEHITYYVQVCMNCGWEFEFEANCAGCGAFCDLPPRP